MPSTHLRTVTNEIKELIKESKKSTAGKDGDVISIKEEPLKPFDDGKRILLHNVTLRPLVTSKKMTGSLEAFKNAFCYTKKSGERYIIPYSAIKNSIYLPCNDSNVIIAVHFRLNGMMSVGNRKTEDIQFYAEAGELSESLDVPSAKRRKSSHQDEYHEEEMAKQLMKRLRATFITFCRDVEEKTQGLINFERPDGDIEFYATPIRSVVNISSAGPLLISIIEWPAFILDISEVELVYVERDIETLRTCDLAIIFKDYNKKVLIMRSIDRNNLDKIKIWLK